MQFTVGAVAYCVCRQWSLVVDGKAADGYCASSLRMIFLDGDLADEMIEQTLRHEHAHAWEFEVGVPTTIEDRANFAATVGATFERDYRNGGGLRAILAMEPIGLRPSPRRREPADIGVPKQSADRVECGRCGSVITCGSIYTGPPRNSDRAGITVVDRGCRCPACGVVQVWIERISQDGFPLGEFYGARLLDGEDAEGWIAEHGELPCPHSQC